MINECTTHVRDLRSFIPFSEVQVDNLMTMMEDLELNDLVAAAESADITEVLTGEQQLTVFAPVDGSFEGIEDEAEVSFTKSLHNLDVIRCLFTFFKQNFDEPAAIIVLGDDAGSVMSEVLQSHVVVGAYKNYQLEDDQLLTSLAGSTIRINKYAGQDMVMPSQRIL